MDGNKIYLEFPKGLTHIAGYELGERIFKEQVLPFIELEKENIIVIPNQIQNISIAFTQGLKSGLLNTNKLIIIKYYSEVESLALKLQSYHSDYNIIPFESLFNYSFNGLEQMINKMGNTGEKIKEYLLDILSTERLFQRYIHNDGVPELIFRSGNSNICFEIKPLITDNSVKFSNISLSYQIPLFFTDDNLTGLEKINIICNYNIRTGYNVELNPEELDKPIFELIEYINQIGTKHNTAYKNYIKAAIVGAVYDKASMHNSFDIVNRYLSPELQEKIQDNFYSEEILDYIINNHITLLNYKL